MFYLSIINRFDSGERLIASPDYRKFIQSSYEIKETNTEVVNWHDSWPTISMYSRISPAQLYIFLYDKIFRLAWASDSLSSYHLKQCSNMSFTTRFFIQRSRQNVIHSHYSYGTRELHIYTMNSSSLKAAIWTQGKGKTSLGVLTYLLHLLETFCDVQCDVDQYPVSITLLKYNLIKPY